MSQRAKDRIPGTQSYLALIAQSQRMGSRGSRRGSRLQRHRNLKLKIENEFQILEMNNVEIIQVEILDEA